MASIKICVETLLAHSELDEEKRRRFLERCLSNTDRLQKLLGDVSLITRMDDGASSVVKEDIDLRRIIQTVVDDRRIIAETKGIEIENSVAFPLPMRGNISLLEAVFYNLIDNAIAYSGGNRIKIAVAGEDEGKIMLTFADNGNGVADEHLQKMFERFDRIDKGRSRAAGGTGLGLSIVKNAVALHGGTISASNLRTGGLIFRISLSRI